MAKAISDIKKRGRPATGEGTPIMVRLQPDLLSGVDAFAAGHNDVSRPEAVRRILQEYLTERGHLK